MPELGLYPCACFDIAFSGIDWPNAAAGFNFTYRHERGSQHKRLAVRAFPDLTSAQKERIEECAKDCGHESLAAFWECFDRNPQSCVRRLPAQFRDLAKELLEFEATRTRWVVSPEVYWDKETPTPTTVVICMWRKRSWDLTDEKCYFFD